MITQAVNATLRTKAAFNLEQVNAQIHELTQREHGYQREKLQLHSERIQYQVRRDELCKIIQAAGADRSRAAMEVDISMNTPAEVEAAQRLAAIDRCIAEAQQDIGVIDALYQIDGSMLVWQTREAYLDQFISDCGKERKELLQKRADLEAIHTRVHAAHGQDEQAAILAEFAALADQDQAVAAQLHQVADLRSQLQATISTRLADWPSLALELEMQFGDYVPVVQVRILDQWLQLLEQIEQHARELEPALIDALSFRHVPTGTLAAYGARAAQRHPVTAFDKTMPELYNFDGYIKGLERLRDAMVSAGKRRQADGRVFAPAQAT